MDAYHILVIVLASLLAVGLFLGVVCTAIFIKVLSDIRHITEKAASAADNIQHAAELFKNTTGVAAVTKVIGNAVQLFSKNRTKRER